MFIYKKCLCANKPHEKINRVEFFGVARKMKLLADPSRISILSVLYRAPHCVSDIQKHTGFSQALVSHHLKKLIDENFVISKRDGKFINYRLTIHGKKLITFVRAIKCKKIEQK